MSVLLIIVIVPFLQFVLNLNYLPSKASLLVNKSALKILIQQDEKNDGIVNTPKDISEEIDLDVNDVEVYQSVELFDTEEDSVALELYRNKTYKQTEILNKSTEQVDLTVWSLNDQFGVLQDLILLFSQFGIRFHHYELQSLCTRFKNCPSVLQGVTVNHMMDRLPTVTSEVHHFLSSIPQFVQSDIVLCVSPTSLCDIYRFFNKPIIIYVADRYNHGITSAQKWRNWNKILHGITSDPRNIVAASSDYDIQYCNYFTSKEPKLLPHFAGYIKPQNKLVKGPSIVGLKSFTDSIHAKKFLLDFHKLSKKGRSSIQLQPYVPDVVNYKAIVYLPSRVSNLKFIELYRLNIPIFVPSLELLTRWHYKEHVITYKSRHSGSVSGVPRKSEIRGVVQLPDPNNDRDLSSIGFWLNFMDIYSMPNIQYFKSLEELITMLNNMENSKVDSIKNNMEKYNDKQMKQTLKHWFKLLLNVKNNFIKNKK